MSRPAPLLLAAGLLATSLLPLATPAAADTGPVLLGMSSFARIVADEAHGRLFLSSGPTGAGLRVTDLEGGSATTLDLPGATGLALTPDGGSLWVTLPGAGALARVDTATLTIEQRIGLPTGQCPGDVAVVGDRLVYGHSCSAYVPGSGSYGGLGVVDAATGASYGGVTSPGYRPVVAAGPAGLVYAADAGPNTTSLFLYDVTGTAPRLVAARASACSDLHDLSASPDGSSVVTACGSSYQHEVWTAAKLEPTGSFFSGSSPVAGAWSADGRTFVAGLDSEYEPDVYVHRVDEQRLVRDVDFGAATSLLQPRGLAASTDGLRAWAVASSPGGLALHVVDVPSPSAAGLTAGADPSALYAGGSTTVSGRLLTASGEPLTGEVLQVSRGATGEVPVALPNVVTDAQGSYAFRDTPPRAGSYVYAVSRASDAARAEVPVLLWRTEGGLSLELTRGTSGGVAVTGTLRLTYDGPTSPAGRTVTLVRAAGGVQTALPPVTTDTTGRASFSDSPPAGDATYRATVAPHGVHPEVTTTRTTTVLTATKLTATAPTSATVGSLLRVSGVLTQPAGAVGGAAVSVRRSGCGSASPSWSATTTPNGAWSVDDASPLLGTCTYTASYAGGGRYAPSTASAASTVTLRPTVLTASSPSSADAGSRLTLTGQLTSGTAAVPTATVRVSRSGCAATTSIGAVTTAPDGSWSVVDPGVPGGACTWTATYAGDGSTYAGSSTTASTPVSFLTPALSLSVVRGTGSTKKNAYVTAQLGTTFTNRTVTITAQPSGGSETTLRTGEVDAAGKLTATYTPKGTTTYRVKFAGDAWYAARTVGAVS